MFTFLLFFYISRKSRDGSHKDRRQRSAEGQQRDGERRTRARELDDEDEEEDNHVEKQHHLEEHLISMSFWCKFEADLVMFHGSN